MEEDTRPLWELRTRFEPERSCKIDRRWQRVGGVVATLATLGCAANVELLGSGWSAYVILATMLMATGVIWSTYLQSDQNEAILVLIRHVEKLEEIVQDMEMERELEKERLPEEEEENNENGES